MNHTDALCCAADAFPPQSPQTASNLRPGLGQGRWTPGVRLACWMRQNKSACRRSPPPVGSRGGARHLQTNSASAPP